MIVSDELPNAVVTIIGDTILVNSIPAAKFIYSNVCTERELLEHFIKDTYNLKDEYEALKEQVDFEADENVKEFKKKIEVLEKEIEDLKDGKSTPVKQQPTLIVAGHLSEARRFAADKGLARGKWRYLGNPSYIHGLPKGQTIFAVGTWRDNPEWQPLEELCRIGGHTLEIPS